jgi:hypothetical protein
MVPPKPGIYWIKTRIRYLESDPPEGNQEWMLAEYSPDGFGWSVMGDECGVGETLVVHIGPAVLPPTD